VISAAVKFSDDAMKAEKDSFLFKPLFAALKHGFTL
jgi:hypothetical protein